MPMSEGEEQTANRLRVIIGEVRAKQAEIKELVDEAEAFLNRQPEKK